MKILHGPQNIGGMANTLAHAQRELGHDAYSYSFSANQFKFQSDYTLKNSTSIRERLQKAFEFGREFDVFQFYFGESLLGSNLLDVSLLSKLGKKIFFYFCGCDIRDEKKTIMSYDISGCAACFPKLCSKNRKLAFEISRNYGKVNFVSTPDLLEFVENSILLPQAVNFEELEPLQTNERHAKATGDTTFVVAHAPTHQGIKGTQYVIDTVSNLKSRGLNICLKLIENMPHQLALETYQQADLAIDQLLVGAYGLVAAEMMAMGVPTMVYIRDDLLEKYPDNPPVINTSIFSLEDQLVYFYENREELNKYQSQGIKYALKHHHPSQLAIKCLEYYES